MNLTEKRWNQRAFLVSEKSHNLAQLIRFSRMKEREIRRIFRTQRVKLREILD